MTNEKEWKKEVGGIAEKAALFDGEADDALEREEGIEVEEHKDIPEKEMPDEKELSAAPEKEEDERIDEGEAEKLCSHPMFTRFACGRQEPFDAILHAFRQMLCAGGGNDPREEIRQKMTPAPVFRAEDTMLTDRQRAICRAAGMSYGEYHALLNHK